jgi:hypothetical protein
VREGVGGDVLTVDEQVVGGGVQEQVADGVPSCSRPVIEPGIEGDGLGVAGADVADLVEYVDG